MKTPPLFDGFRFGMLLQLAVGPVCLFVLNTAVSSGFAAAESAAVGAAAVDALYIFVALLGIGSLMDRSKKAKRILSLCGAAVLILFGLSEILGALGFGILPHFSVSLNSADAFAGSVLLTLSNPLTILFWAGVFSDKISRIGGGRGLYLFGLGSLCSTLFFLSLTAAVGSFAGLFLSPLVIQFLNIGVGAALIFFGIRTLLKQRG